MNKVEVSIKPFYELFDKRKSLKIPEYQRPYIWGQDKNEDLLKDFKEHFLETESGEHYYMGAILFYYNKKESCYEIIDGQQRITTLLIIQSLLHQNGAEGIYDISFNSHQSVKYIQAAQTYYYQHVDLLQKLQKAKFLDRLNFTLIITQSEDEAFTFFDTQNNRGIKLNATDFLKAYHLRSIDSINLQEQCAILWEKSSAKTFEGPYLSHLFEKVLWRARNWKGQDHIDFENRDEILKTFQKQSRKPDIKDSYPLYPNFYNRFASGQIFKDNGEVITYLAQQNSNDASAYPFTLRQPLYKGLNFFKYSEKYVSIHELLFRNEKVSDSGIIAFRRFFTEVYNYDMSVYLRHFMQLCIIAYYDIFGNNQVYKAALCFDLLIGSVRIQKQQVKKEAVTNCLKKNRNNILDIITQAYLPDEIFDFVLNLNELDKVYFEENLKKEGVQKRYKDRVLKYFKKEEIEFKNRKQWINQ